MTDDDFPDGLDPRVEESAAQPMDAADLAVLGQLAQLFADVDPVPDDLVGRIRFSLALDEVYAEVAELTRMSADAVAVRHDPVAAERTESLTFSAERLTAMVTVSRSDGELRLDGWVAPAGRFLVRLRMQQVQREVTTDETGRFVVERLTEGFAQLVFTRVDEHGAAEADAVVTPLFQL